MKDLKLFLKALESVLSIKGFYVERLTITPKSLAPVYKVYKLEVYRIYGTKKELVSTVSITEKIISEFQEEKIKEKLILSTIINMLKLYEIQ